MRILYFGMTGRNPVPKVKAKGWRFEPDKFAAAGLTGEPSHLVRPPRVAECPIQLEARAERTGAAGRLRRFRHRRGRRTRAQTADPSWLTASTNWGRAPGSARQP
ncbi:hypothetical protein GCM10018779_52750 [Streptomyces griseocarneus]|nr:hypothetical protein GCM10018779_52750 [Streptomyces griseocarneus]